MATTGQKQAAAAIELPSRTADGRAREPALAALAAGARKPSSLVPYRSLGELLVIDRFRLVGDEERTVTLARELSDRLHCTVLLGGLAGAGVDSDLSIADVTVAVGEVGGVTGHLGEFGVDLVLPDGPVNLARYLGMSRDHFDLVLDLSLPPQLRQDIVPPGYYAPAGDPEALRRALAELPEMVGEFEKPKFFDYNPDICAHGSSGLKGCTRCIDICPTIAIRSIGDKIEVDPHLCQGAGACATACPTGAITYAYPAVSDLLAGLRALLKAYREAGGTQPTLVFHDAERGKEILAAIADELPERILPVEVEEVGSVGMDAWLAGLAYGASHVVLLAPPTVAQSVKRELGSQVAFAHAVLEGMGYAGERVRLLEVGEPSEAIASLRQLSEQSEIRPATFAAVAEKRTNIRSAVDHLYAQARNRPAFTALPAGAPFGQIRVDRKGCTLCMACASVCPHSAVSAAGDIPQLLFDEWNCVQCGLCERACPEHVITLEPRFLYDPEMRRATRVLNEDEPFCCIVCGKPFATHKMMTRMQEKLRGHWMFQKPEAMRRMQMCEDCRVKDLYVSEGLIDVHNKP